MQIRPASLADIGAISEIIVGDPTQASTAAGMRLFGLPDRSAAIELNQLLIASTGGWRTMTVADDRGGVGVVQIGDAFLALTPEIAGLARRLHGDGFEAVLGPRLVALSRVQSSYPDDCLRLSEIHVAAHRRGEGIGGLLMEHVLEVASRRDLPTVALQTLIGNPARSTFEAWDFSVRETTTDPEFEELTGYAGYHLMMREVGRPASA